MDDSIQQAVEALERFSERYVLSDERVKAIALSGAVALVIFAEAMHRGASDMSSDEEIQAICDQLIEEFSAEDKDPYAPAIVVFLREELPDEVTFPEEFEGFPVYTVVVWSEPEADRCDTCGNEGCDGDCSSGNGCCGEGCKS